jgi:hypothetical protein
MSDLLVRLVFSEMSDPVVCYMIFSVLKENTYLKFNCESVHNMVVCGLVVVWEFQCVTDLYLLPLSALQH